MSDTILIILAVLGGIAGVVLIGGLIWAVSVSNRFSRKSVKIEEALSGIEAALTKRYDTLSKMVEVARSYCQHELDTMNSVVRLRKGMDVKALADSAGRISEVENSVQVLAEAYPELRSNTVFEELQKGIRETEEHLQAARRLYNANVSSYNQMLSVFPSSLIGNFRGLTEKEFFTAEGFRTGDVEISL